MDNAGRDLTVINTDCIAGDAVLSILEYFFKAVDKSSYTIALFFYIQILILKLKKISCNQYTTRSVSSD